MYYLVCKSLISLFLVQICLYFVHF
eukprot:UN12871